MIKKLIYTCLGILAYICSVTVNAQVTARLNLDQAIRLAQEQSLKKSSIDAVFESQRWSYKSSNASRFASISVSGNVPGLNRQINPITQPDGTILYIPQSTAVSSVSLLINQPIMPLGGNIWVSSSLSRIDLFSSGTSYWSSSPLLVGLNLPVAAFNRRRWEWKQAKLQYTRNISNYAEALEDLSISVIQAYFDLYIADIENKNAKQNQVINDSIFIISQGRFNVGKIAENELLQVELNLMNAKNAASQSNLNKEIAEQRLKILLGLNPNESVLLDSIPPLRILEVDVMRAITEAKENSGTIVQYQLNANDALMNMKEAGRNRYVNANISATFGLNQTNPDFAQVYSNPQNSQTATLNFNIPIYNFGKAKADYRMNKAIYESNQAEIQLALLNFEVNIKQLVLDLKRLESAVIISEKSNEIAQRRYEVSKNRFLIGKIDITNLTIAQTEKDQALLSYVRSLREYWVAYYQLRKATLFDFESNQKLIVMPERKIR